MKLLKEKLIRFRNWFIATFLVATALAFGASSSYELKKWECMNALNGMTPHEYHLDQKSKFPREYPQTRIIEGAEKDAVKTCKDGELIEVTYPLEGNFDSTAIPEARKIDMNEIGRLYKDGVLYLEKSAIQREVTMGDVVASALNFVAYAGFPTDDFESCADGSGAAACDEDDLNGQTQGTGWAAGWSCNVLYNYEGTSPLVGNVMVDGVDDLADPECTRTMNTNTTDSSVLQIVAELSVNVDRRFFFQTRTAGGTNQHSWEFRTTGQISIIDDTTQTNIQAYSAATPYWLEFRPIYSTETFTVRICTAACTTEPWSSTYTLRDNASVDHTQGSQSVRFVFGSTGVASTIKFDDVKDVTPAAAAATTDENGDFFQLL